MDYRVHCPGQEKIFIKYNRQYFEFTHNQVVGYQEFFPRYPHIFMPLVTHMPTGTVPVITIPPQFENGPTLEDLSALAENETATVQPLTAKHKGGGRWIVVNAEGVPIHEGYLKKDEAQALVEQG